MTRIFFLAGAGVFLVVGCGTFQAGFSNASSPNRQSQPQSSHDVITNGPESCSRANAQNDDPLRYRVPPCRSEEQHAFLPADGGAN